MAPVADKFSTLPDPLLGLILSKIPIKQAVRCSILSKRWRLIYTQIPRLTLTPSLILGYVDNDPDPLQIAKVENIISNFLVLHSTEAFRLPNYRSRGHYGYNVNKKWQFSRQSVWKWVRYAASRNVQRLTICTSYEIDDVPPALFSCAYLTELELFNCILNRIPPRFSGFNYLVTSFFWKIEFTDESLSCFSHCPFLEKLEIVDSVGLQKPVISAPNLKYLVIRARKEVELLIVNCPKLITLDACNIRDSRVNVVLFQEISYAVRYLEMRSGSSVIVLRLEWAVEEDDLWVETCNFSAERFVEFVGAFKALKELSMPNWSLVQAENEMVELIHKLFNTLPNLQRLDMPGVFILEIVRDPLPSCLSSLLAHLRKINVEILEYDEREIAVLSSFLEGCSTLEIMELQLEEITLNDTIEFLTKLLYVRRASKQAIVNIVTHPLY